MFLVRGINKIFKGIFYEIYLILKAIIGIPLALLEVVGIIISMLFTACVENLKIVGFKRLLIIVILCVAHSLKWTRFYNAEWGICSVAWVLSIYFICNPDTMFTYLTIQCLTSLIINIFFK